MSDKFAIMSLSVKPEMQDLLKVSGKKMGKSVSELIRILVSKYLPLVVNDGTEQPIVFKIPVELKDKPEELKSWFNLRVDAVIKKLGESEPQNQ